MTCLLMPENHTPGNVQAERNFADKVLKRANGLISISHHTKVGRGPPAGIESGPDQGDLSRRAEGLFTMCRGAISTAWHSAMV
jgi:hypothetical protein